ncbi:hypothetical protein [Rhodococcus sp. NPDC004095]
MNVKQLNSMMKSSRGLQLIIVAGLVVAGTSSVAAFNAVTSTDASDTPLDVKVEDHEQRISKTESDIAQANERVGQVEQKSDENAAAIQQVEERVVVVERGAQASAGQPQQIPQPQATQPSAPVASAPAPINPRLIVGLEVGLTPSSDAPLYRCTYTLESGRVISNLQPTGCLGTGQEISDDLAAMHGVGR